MGRRSESSSRHRMHEYFDLDVHGFAQEFAHLPHHYVGEKNAISLALGTLGLINFCQRHDIEGMFALDKSSRPALHVYKQALSQLLPEVHRPAIRYINIGRKQLFDFKHIETGVLEKLRVRYRDMVDRRVCVVDEYVDSGGTLARAYALFSQLFPHKKIQYVSMLTFIPLWQGNAQVIGVRECQEGSYKQESPLLVQPYHDANHPSPYKSDMRELREEMSILADVAVRHAARISDDKEPYKDFPLAKRYKKNFLQRKNKTI